MVAQSAVSKGQQIPRFARNDNLERTLSMTTWKKLSE
jgi:hypothetical protein